MSRDETNGLGYLCLAWGESDHPVTRLVNTPEEVAGFLCDEWFGELPETMHPENRQQFDDAMGMVCADRYDPDAWDGTDIIEFTFEIGGVRITRAFYSPPRFVVAKARGEA
jgi:hypothetical protein